MKNDWEKKIEKRTSNIGFISRSKAFKDPTPAEKAAALAKETESWQETQRNGWKSSWKISTPYSRAKGPGVNLRATRQCGEPLEKEIRNRAIKAYIETPMDKDGVLKSLGISVSIYEKPKGFFSKMYDLVKQMFKKTFIKLNKRMSYAELQEYFSKEKK